MGFLQICAGVVLLQLSKSAKDVPDAAVFSGDLDQVRTVAEQEEPEYEPRADTIRGGGAILRSISTMRQKKQVEEVKRLQEERMEPVGENEVVEFDGLRRRKTVIGDNPTQGSLRRQKTVHPPLGMSHFPNENDTDDDDASMHPGFLSRLRSVGSKKSTSTSGRRARQPSPMGLTSITSPTKDSTDRTDHVYGLPPGLQRDFIDEEDTSYHPLSGPSQHIHFAPGVEADRPSSRGKLTPKPPHGAKRQFSFQNVFHRNRASSAATDGTDERPTSSSKKARDPSKEYAKLSAPSGSGGGASTTEEERLGLVKGDSNIMLSAPEYSRSPPSYSDREDDSDDWHLTARPQTPASPISEEPGLGFGSPAAAARDAGSRSLTASGNTDHLPRFSFQPHTPTSPVRGRRDTIDEDSDPDTPAKDIEKGSSRGAFL